MSTGELHIGVYVDAENIRYNGGYAMRYDVLRRFAGREDGARLLRLNTYMAVDGERMKRDREYRERIRGYQQAVRDLGWKIIEKPVRWFVDEEGIEEMLRDIYQIGEETEAAEGSEEQTEEE